MGGVDDQLSLSLTGDIARLPRSMRPMLARPADTAFDSDEHMFEPRWGGRRILAFIEPNRAGGSPRLRLIDDNGRDLAPLLPELAIMADLVGDLPAILDGEIVMPDKAGRMDEEALVARLADGVKGETTPVYLAFDLLWAGGRPIIAQPLLKRRERLAKMVRPTAELVILPGVVRDGMDLYFAVAQQGLRGVMARHLRSPYLPGRRSELWQWIASRPGEMPLHAVPDPVTEPPSRPILALIQRLPLDFGPEPDASPTAPART
jgi:bifunctional non-homologous end joining protein LigD/DNA ligase-1